MDNLAVKTYTEYIPTPIAVRGSDLNELLTNIVKLRSSSSSPGAPVQYISDTLAIVEIYKNYEINEKTREILGEVK